MRPRLIQSFARVTHARDALAAIDALANLHHDLAQMTVKAEVGRPIPTMFDDNVAAVI